MSRLQINKTVVLEAPLERVWQAITDWRRFGLWFGAEMEGPFVAGQATAGRMAPTTVDAQVAQMQEACRGMPWVMLVDTIEPMHRFAFRWHPDPVEPGTDFAGQPTTLVTFVLEEVADGVHLTITESGFESIPPERRKQAMEANDGGWTHQCRLIAAYLVTARD